MSHTNTLSSSLFFEIFLYFNIKNQCLNAGFRRQNSVCCVCAFSLKALILRMVHFLLITLELTWYQTFILGASLVTQTVKNLPAMQETWVQSLGQEDPPEKRMAISAPVFLPGEFHGQRSLVGYSQQGHKQLDTTERLSISNSQK